MSSDAPPTILAVDDEPSLTALYEAWLSDRGDVLTATDGTDALELAEDESVDAVMLDRHMPGMTGDEVLDELRDRGHECPVVMVTGVDPDVDIVAMPFDEYLVKPVGRDEVRTTVDTVLSRRTYDEHVREFFALARKKAVLESACTGGTLTASDEYHELTVEFDAARERANTARDDVLEDGFEELALHHG